MRRVRALPGPTQRLMLLAAADPTGDATLLWRAAPTLGLGRDAAVAADEEQLLEIGSRVRFRHPLVRSAAYAAGSTPERRAAHLALAASTDAQSDPERRVWHLAAAATGPDEDVAGELERAADRAQARAGLAAAAAFLQRSVGPDRRTGTTRRPSPGRRPCQPARRGFRPRTRPAGAGGGRRDRRSPARPRGAAPGRGRPGIQLRPGGARAAAPGRQETRVTRSAARPGDLPRRTLRIPGRRLPGRAWRPSERGRPSRTVGAAATTVPRA